MSDYDESSDTSEYLDFQSPLKSSQDSNSLDWDEHQEQLSFVEAPESNSPSSNQHRGRVIDQFHFGSNPEDPYSRWPPTNPQSETDHNILEAGVVLHDPEDTVVEEEYPEVFDDGQFVICDSNIVPAPGPVPGDSVICDLLLVPGPPAQKEFVICDSEKMPPKKKTADELYLAFESGLKIWDTNVARLKAKVAPLKLATIEEVKYEKRELLEEARGILEETEEGADVFQKVKTAINKIGDDLDDLYDKMENIQAEVQRNDPVPPVAAETADQRIDKEVKKFTSILEHHQTSMEKFVNDINNIEVQNQVPTRKSVDEVKLLLSKIADHHKGAEEVYKSILAEISIYSSDAKIKTVKDEKGKVWNNFEKELDAIKAKVDQYEEKLPKEKETKSSIPLERLPLPKFDGSKMSYQRFKVAFEKHVNYDTPTENLLALKERCLLKSADKERIANMVTLDECWKVLDAEYGDTETTVCDVFKQWRALKTPTSDKEIVKFVDTVENGVSCLKALNSSSELTASAVVTLEEKLDKEMQKEVSILIVREKAKDKNKTRMDVVIQYLREVKAAAQLRTTNYSNTSSKSSGGQTSSSSSSFRDGNRSNQTSNRSKGKERRKFNDSSTCLLCEDNHSISSCPMWQDKATDKRFLLGFVWSNMPMCTYCLEIGHKVFECQSEDDTLGCPCGNELNHKFICCSTEECVTRKNWNDGNDSDGTVSGNTNVLVSASNSVTINGCKLGETILPIQKIDVQGSSKKLNTLFDNCSQNSFIRESVAKDLKLKGQNISYTLICSDGSKKRFSSKLYKLKLVDKFGKYHAVELIGIKKLSTNFSGFKVVNARGKLSRFKHCPDLSPEKLNRTSGFVDILLGNDLCGLHPDKVANIDNLVILKSKFGNGYTLKGHNSYHIKFAKKSNGVKVNVCGVENLIRNPSKSPNDPKVKSRDDFKPMAQSPMSLKTPKKESHKDGICNLIKTPPSHDGICDLLLDPAVETSGICDLLLEPAVENFVICDLLFDPSPTDGICDLTLDKPRSFKSNQPGSTSKLSRKKVKKRTRNKVDVFKEPKIKISI